MPVLLCLFWARPALVVGEPEVRDGQLGKGRAAEKKPRDDLFGAGGKASL